jgi:hypothetical protein
MENEIKSKVREYEKLLPLAKSISSSEAEHRAGEFLSALAFITEMRHLLSEEKIKCLTVQTAVYSEQMSKGVSSTMTANKIAAEASPEYTAAREDLERIENDISYLKAFYDIYMAAHVFYRNIAKGESF